MLPMRPARLSPLSLFCLVAALVIAGCGFACPFSSAYHTANRASKQIADDLHEFEQQVEVECALDLGTRQCTGALDTNEAKSLAQYAVDASRANDVFIGRLQSAKTLDTSNKAAIVGYVTELANSIANLNAQGVLRIKNSKSQAKFQLIYQSIEAGLNTLQGLMQGFTSTPTAPTKSDNGPIPMSPLSPLMAGFDVATIGLILAAFNSVSKLVLQARADGSLTDEQLQTAGLSEDSDTQNHAAAFIAAIEGKTPPPAPPTQ